VSESPEQPPAGHPPADSDVTREMPKFTPPSAGPSPWSREYAGPAPKYAPPPPAYAAPETHGWPVVSEQGWPTPPQPGGPSDRTRRGLWTGVTLVAIAIVATLIAVLVSANTGSGSSKSSASGGILQPNPPPSLAVPSPVPTPPGPQSSTGPQSPTNPQNPTSPLPSLGGVTTPPGLLAIGYRAYSLSSVDPSDIALDSAELAQFKKYGLSRVAGLRALTIGPTSARGDDWDADINILQFSSPAAAAAELRYSNAQNKKSAKTIPLPGLPNATAFVNHNSTTGISIGAFTTVGRYQVVVILSGLSDNIPADAAVVAAEAAKVMKAVLPDAATIVPPPAGSGGGSGGTVPGVPGLPTPSPTGTHA
jgi:hypothetical protein